MHTGNVPKPPKRSWAMSGVVSALGVSAVALLLITMTDDAAANGGRRGGRNTDFCSSTASLMFRACGGEVADDYWTSLANCINLSDDGELEACQSDAAEARSEAVDGCREQFEARSDTCDLLGEERYDPDLEPEDFESDYTHLLHPNPYFPLTIGNRWEYREGSEFNTVEIQNHTKLIDDIRCIVGLDQVFDDGNLTEKTNDYFCQAVDGTVWYFGEETSELESFEGDEPVIPEVVSIDGSFKADRDGDKAGIIFLASPHPGDAYLEEFSLGNAEDLSVVLSTSYKFGPNHDLDTDVPKKLADLFCASGDCVVTRNTSQLEPGGIERKYYARGVGVFLEVNLNSHKISQLTGCNFDSRCAMLPVH